MAKKFDEHMHVDKVESSSKKEFDDKRMICMCENHKARIGHCQCKDQNPCIFHSVRQWGNFDQLKRTCLFTDAEIIAALKDYS